jgi:hypothetical protein
MLFHISFTDPAAQLAALLAAADDHQARALVLGNGVFRGFFDHPMLRVVEAPARFENLGRPDHFKGDFAK